MCTGADKGSQDVQGMRTGAISGWQGKHRGDSSNRLSRKLHLLTTELTKWWLQSTMLILLFYQLVCQYPASFKKCSNVEYARAYRINWKIKTPYAGNWGILLHKYEKLTIDKLKSSRLSCSLAVRLSIMYFPSNISKYNTNDVEPAVSLFSSSPGYNVSTSAWK